MITIYYVNIGSDNTMITKRKATMIRMPITLDQQLKDLADKQGQTKNSIMVTALQQYIERNDK